MLLQYAVKHHSLEPYSSHWRKGRGGGVYMFAAVVAISSVFSTAACAWLPFSDQPARVKVIRRAVKLDR